MRYLILMLLLSSCSATNLLNRAEKLIKKAEAKGAHWSSDTIKQTIPVFIKEFHIDTIVSSVTGDTVYINKERVKIKYVKLPGDSVFIDVKLPPDTIYKEVNTVITKTISGNRFPWWVFILIGFALGCLILFFLLKSLKGK